MIIYRYLIFLLFVLNHPCNKDHKLKTLARILWWKINRIFFKLPCIVELIPNIKMICYPNDSLYSTLVVYLRLPEYGEVQLLLNILKTNDNFIDVGANIGVYSLLASSKIKEGKVFSFEPSPKILPQLNENIVLNQKESSIDVIEKAVSDRIGLIDFDITSNPDYNHISYSFGNESALRVATITLDKFVSDNNLKYIKLIKIDVEGAELMVLKGLQKSFEKRKVTSLIVEVSNWTISRFGITVEDIVNFLRAYGFGIYMFNKDFKLVNFSVNENRGWNIVAVHKSRSEIIKRFNQTMRITE